MVISLNLYDALLREPYQNGCRNLKVLSGYASSAFLHHVANDFSEAQIELFIGMARKEGIRSWDHAEFLRLSRTFPQRIKVFYHTGEQPVHAKCISWTSANNYWGFVGSANFSWNGFGAYLEAVAEEPSLEEVQSLFKLVVPLECEDPDVVTKVPLIDVPYRFPNANSLKELAEESPSICLYLFHQRNRVGSPVVHERSGLNWGQRPEYNRDPDQAYIPVPQEIHRLQPGFFPPRNHEFSIVTDDGQSFIAVMAQDNRKAIETKYDNSILGRYFRDRLGVPRGEIVLYQHLEQYGRMSITLHKLDEDLFFLDFSNKKEA